MPEAGRQGRYRLVAITAGILLAGSACASRDNSAQPPGGTRTSAVAHSRESSSTAGRTAGYARSARALAARIPGCTAEPTSEAQAAGEGVPIARALFADANSAATCSLQGRRALLLTFDDRTAEATVRTTLLPRLAYYASGPGWAAVPVDVSEPVGEQSVVQDCALALGGRIVVGADAPRATVSAP